MPQTDVVSTSAIESLLCPGSIAIVGASGDPSKIGAMPLTFLRKYGYGGRIYPINPNYQDIDGLACHPSIAGLPEPVDLMVVTVPAHRVPAVFEECEPGRVKSALVLTSGYAETGPQGARRQAELVELASERGIRVCGPNSVGSVNLWNAVVPSISQAFDKILEPGPVAFVSQSGALGTAVIALAQAAGIKLGYFVNTGNEADLNFTDFCDYFVSDPHTLAIAGYLEGLRDGRRFADCARRALAAGKPIILLKVGRSSVGTAAARSHTGAMTGSDDLYEAVFRSYGVTRVDSIEALIDTLKVFSALRAPTGRRLVLVSHSGGTGVLMADGCEVEQVEVPPVGSALRERLQARLPDFASLSNPIDMTAGVIFQPKVMVGCLEDALAAPDFDAGVLSVNLMWRVQDELVAELTSLRERVSNPFAVAWIGIAESVAARLQQSGVPAFSDPIRCIRALGRLIRWGCSRDLAGRMHPVGDLTVANQPGEPVLASQRRRLARPRTYAEQAMQLENYGLPLVPWRLVRSPAEAHEAAKVLGYPVVAKVVSDGFIHKSDAGALALGLKSGAELDRALHRFKGLVGDDWGKGGVLIQPMVHEAVEVFVGAQVDPIFGPFVAVGLGGIYVEVFRDTIVRLAPLTEAEATDVLQNARWFPLLRGVRGQPKRDISALARVIQRTSTLITREAVTSMDLNPVMVLPDGQGAVVVDFRLFGPDDADVTA